MARAENRAYASKAQARSVRVAVAVWGDAQVGADGRNPIGMGRKGNLFKTRGYSAAYRNTRKDASHAAAHKD
jgi:hypothetical protein